MILGHLLNHNLGGSGRDFRNLTAITRSTNALMSSRIEEKAKADLENGLIINYKVSPIYGGNVVKNKPSNLGESKAMEIVQTEESTPKSINYDYKSFKLKSDGKKEVVNDAPGKIDNELDFNNGEYRNN